MTSRRSGRILWLAAAIWMIGLFNPQFVAQHALAADMLWNLPENGIFTLASNWFGGVPGPDDVARFETTNSDFFQQAYTVSFANDPTNQQLVVEDDNVTFNLIGSPSNHTYTLTNQFVAVALGTVPNRSGNLTINRGTLMLPSQVGGVRRNGLEIGSAANAEGVLTVGAGGQVLGGSDVAVGLNGKGTLEIKDGGSMIADDVTIAANNGSKGSMATITGNGSSFSSDELDINNGELNVTSGGDVVSRISFIGRSADSVGKVTVDGSGSTWDVSSLRVAGAFSELGTLNITGGGYVTSTSASLGSNDATGNVNVASTIPGVGSTWNIDSFLEIGERLSFGGARGTLLIQPGGTVSVDGVTQLGRNGLVRLEGGAFRTEEMTFLGGATEGFSWIAGTLRVNVFDGDLTVPSGGVLAPIPSADGTTVKGDYNQQSSGSTLAVEIGGPFPTEYSVVHSLGAATLGGTLQLNLTDAFVPTTFNTFDILQADGGITGSFANVANGQRLFTSDGLGSFVVNYGPGNPNPNHVILSAFVPGGLLPGDFNHNGTLDAADIDDLTIQTAGGTHPTPYDLNADALVNDGDIKVWVGDLFHSWIGDANLDGQFNSSDLVSVLAAGTYEVDINSVWSTGDFNGDGRTNSSDLVSALADGGYEQGPRAAVSAVPEPASFVMLMAGLIGLTIRPATRRSITPHRVESASYKSARSSRSRLLPAGTRLVVA